MKVATKAILFACASFLVLAVVAMFIAYGILHQQSITPHRGGLAPNNHD